MEIRAAGKDVRFGIRDNSLYLIREIESHSVEFPLSKVADRQISLLRGKEIALAAFDASGTVLNLVSTTGLMVFLESDATHVEPVWFNTMRVIWSDGRIVPYRTAIEDQFRFDTCRCPFSADGLILVPFQIVFDQNFAVVRVQPPDKTSCLVRLAYRVGDGDENEKPATRQALMHDDWRYIYEMGIVDMKLRAGVVLVLTHTCAVELFLADHDPTPIAMSLPRDRIDVLFSDDYVKFSQCYRRYIDFLPKMKTMPSDEKSTKIFPPEWEVVFHGQKTELSEIAKRLIMQERLRPRLLKPLREEMQVVTETAEEESKSNLVSTVLDFGDTRPSYACPWIELAVTDTTLYLNTFGGVYVCKSEWMPLISAKSGRSVYAVNIYASAKYLFVQEDDSLPWRRFDFSGAETELAETSPLLFAFDEILVFAAGNNL